jgi:hypothetical protein
MVYTSRKVDKEPNELILPLSRLNEFLLASVSNRCMTTSEIEALRESCLRGQAKVWGVPVKFINEPPS